MNMTFIVPISPIPQHPDISYLETVMSSIRHHYPTAEVFLLFDGVREEHEGYRQAYEEGIAKALALAATDWHPVVPYVFDSHLHQVGMLRQVIGEVRTDLLCFVESDTPLVTDAMIDWASIERAILVGASNVVRLYHEAVRPAEHDHLYYGAEPGFPYLERTSQWSSRPHVSSTAYYKRILSAHFSPTARCFSEDVMHGVLQSAYDDHGLSGWMQHRVHLYTPLGASWQRSLNLDGRADWAKLDEDQAF
jgi:hypothetical protein